VASHANDYGRRTASPLVRRLRDLEENAFWLQAQTVLLQHLKSPDRDSRFYVPVEFRGKPLSEHILDFLAIPGPPDCLLLRGQYGVGKTSALRHLANDHLLVAGKYRSPWACVYFDGNAHSAEIEEDPGALVAVLRDCVADFITEYLVAHDLTRSDFFEEIFANDPSFANMRLMGDFSAGRQTKIQSVLTKSKARALNVYLRFLSRRVGPYRLILILDNLDHLPSEAQLEAVSRLSQLAKSCMAKGIVSVRQVTDAKLRHQDSRIVSSYVRATVPPPSMEQVIRLRLGEAVRSPEAQNATLGDGAHVFKVRDCTEFETVVVRGLSAPRTRRLLNGMSNESVRDAQQFAVRIYNSAFLDARRIIRKLSPVEQIVPSLWTGRIPYYVVLKSIILCNKQVYDPDSSWVGNVFGTTFSQTHLGPFLRLLIMRFIQRYDPQELKRDAVLEKLQGALGADEAVLRYELKWLTGQDSWLAEPDHSTLGLSHRGRFVLESLVLDHDYLTYIATDVDMAIDAERKLIAPAERFEDRINNLIVLMEHLVVAEQNMLVELAKTGLLGGYPALFGGGGITRPLIERCRKEIAPQKRDREQDDPQFRAIAEECAEKLDRLRRDADFSQLFSQYRDR